VAEAQSAHDRTAAVLAALLVPPIAILSWPFRTDPGVTLDLSWEIGLHQAAAAALRFGHDVVWTYGPLGFLAFPTPFVGATSALAFLAVVLLVGGSVAILLAESRRLFPLWIAPVVALLAARALAFILPTELLQFAALALGVEVLRREDRAGPYRIPVAAGILAAIAILAKLNVGVFLLAGGGAVILAVASPRLRGLSVYGATFVVASVALWLATGQQVLDLLSYARASVDVISGYSEAMANDKPGMVLAILTFAFVAALMLSMAYVDSRAWPRDRRLALAAVMALLTYALWKHGFVRGHFSTTFVTLGFAMLVVVPRSLPRWASAGLLGIAGAAFLVVTQASPIAFIDPRRSPVEFTGQAVDALLPWRWEEAATDTRRRLQSSFGVPSDILADLAGHTVHIDPYQAAVATAYPIFTWHPLPVFQSYQAYTPALDELNAAALRSPDRPERILRRYDPRSFPGGTFAYAVDARNYWFESPAATLERLCRYREIAAGATWQVLGDTGHGCGASTPMGRVMARLGESVAVPEAPSPDSFVVVRVLGLDAGLLGRLRVLAWRAPESFVLLDGNRFRLVPSTAAAGLVLAVPPVAQGSPPFAFGDPVRSISIQARQADADRQVTFEFVAISATGQ
jgi:hypothetical protein